MRIVIDIPETIYKAIKEETYCGILDADVYYAIKDGTPLPKGYSDLIDRDKLLKELKESAKYHSENFEINGHIRDVECFNAGIKYALTVIDKYKEVE